ncbi:MAG: hypothetical protein JNL28_12405 [Planctomycetes bacterium]|nr:hypothetical protein [Planctomycetota bacterium]
MTTRAEVSIPTDRSYAEGPDVPMRIYVGTSDAEMVAVHVLEHTIRKHASRPVEFVPMRAPQPTPRKKEHRAATRFTFKRFMIPALAGYRGRALYMDSDMHVFGDMAELWRLPFGKHRVLCSVQLETPESWKNPDSHFHPGRHFAFMLLDCSRLDWDADEIVRGLDEGRYTYKALTKDLCIVPSDEIGETIPTEWNSLEKYVPGVTKNVHYTVIRTQPWRYEGNPLEDLWMSAYRETVASGKITLDMVLDAIEHRWVKPAMADVFPGGREARETLAFKMRTARTRTLHAVRRAILGRGH